MQSISEALLLSDQLRESLPRFGQLGVIRI